MEILNFTVPPLTPRISHIPSFCALRFSNSNCKYTRNPSASSRKLYLYCPFSISLSRPAIASSKLHISAQFNRPTRRKNYLRKKLIQHRQFHQVSPLQIPVRESRENDEYKLNLDSSIEQRDILEERSNLGDSCSASGDVREPETKSMRKQLGMLNKLEDWVEQYKRDVEFWGSGNGPIFTVFQDSEGKVERVVVDEDEIMKRSGVDPRFRKECEAAGLTEVIYKISFAKEMAREMESGRNVIMKDSSVAEFVSHHSRLDLMEVIGGVLLKPSLLPSISRAGVIVLCGLIVVWAIKGLSSAEEDSKKHMRLEKDILRSKTETRKEEKKIINGNVEVIQDPVEPKSIPIRRPQLDKEELLNNIDKSKGLNHELSMAEYPKYHSEDFENTIQQIRAMARHAREIEKEEASPDIGDEENESTVNALCTGNMNLPKRETAYIHESDETTECLSVNNGNPLTDAPNHLSNQLHGSSSRTKLRVIKSVKEAREYLSIKHSKLVNRELEASSESGSALTMPLIENSSGKTAPASLDSTNEIPTSSSTNGHDYLHHPEDHNKNIDTVDRNADSFDDFQKSIILSGPEVCVSNQFTEIFANPVHGESEADNRMSKKDNWKNENPKALSGTSYSTTAEADFGGSTLATELAEVMPGPTIGSQEDSRTVEPAPKLNWIENNFHELEPLVERISVGFKDNYLAARERSNHGLTSGIDLTQVKTNGDEHEFEWMKDERLREIVFKVRDNELSGRDPFHLLNDEEKYAFFSGLEKKVEHENENLLKVHEYFHANIENLDYGTDGISLYDPPEKIIPRWKVAPAETNPEFLHKFVEQRKALIAESLKNSFVIKKTEKDTVHKPEELSSNNNNRSTRSQNEIAASSKTIIEGSDGSVRAGKKSGREYWQHTKKWSRGFQESYNAETDPEVKAVMKDIGKDLDRWITEKEIKEAADFMEKLPEKGQKLVKEKLDKVRREMELFGPQAVVSKYREYADEKEEDYLWWLDLPYVLCIELYTMDNGEQRVGFYSLEMGADLELDPKQYHVIAFENVGDCKNLCYIVQAHLEMLGTGNAFVVSRPPKDAYRGAKANGFCVTVVRKGQLQLNIDQTLEEVEEEIVEIGSKIYHDKIMQERSVDIKALVKGVFGVSKPARRKRIRRGKT